MGGEKCHGESNQSKFSSVIIDIALDRESYDLWRNKIRFLMVDKNNVVNIDASIIKESISHGGECIRYYESAAQKLVSHFILLSRDDKNKGSVSDLITALKWCVENNISLISLSMGTTRHCDSDKFRSVISRIKESDICLIAGTSNSRVLSYPACFDECIGVCYDYTRNLIDGSFAYIENPIDGVEIVLNPTATSLEPTGSTSMATAYFAGLVAKAISRDETTPAGVKNWIAENSGVLRAESIYDYTYKSVVHEVSDEVVIVVFEGILSNEKALSYRRALQKLFLQDDYYCLSLYSHEKLVFDNDVYSLEFVRCNTDHTLSYDDYVDIMIKLCEPNLLFVDAESYSKTPDVVISKNVKTRIKDGVLYLNYKKHTPQEAFGRIVSNFASEGASETEDKHE